MPQYLICVHSKRAVRCPRHRPDTLSDTLSDIVPSMLQDMYCTGIEAASIASI